MKINIKDKEIELKYSFRAIMIYEKMTGESFNPKGTSEMLLYFYSIILGSDKEFMLDFDEFIDWIDNNPQVLNDFVLWLSQIISKNDLLNDSNEDDNKETDPKPVKKK